MRSLLLLAALSFLVKNTALAQELAMPNGSFEHWHKAGLNYDPDYWTTNNTSLFTGVVRDSIYHLDSAYSMRVLTNGLATSFKMEPLVSQIMYRYFCNIATKDSIIVKLLEYRGRELVDSDLVVHHTSRSDWTLGYLPIKTLYDSVQLLVIGGHAPGTVFNIDRAVYYAIKTGVATYYPVTRAELSPNPMDRTSTLRFNNPEHRPHRWMLTDAGGRIVRICEDLRAEELCIERGNLPPGVYNWNLQAEGMNSGAAGKLFVH